MVLAVVVVVVVVVVVIVVDVLVLVFLVNRILVWLRPSTFCGGALALSSRRIIVRRFIVLAGFHAIFKICTLGKGLFSFRVC